jgi:hypothetical protein
MSLPSLCVGARSERCSTSNQCTFHVEELPHLVFCAHAVEGGTVVLQQVCLGPGIYLTGRPCIPLYGLCLQLHTNSVLCNMHPPCPCTNPPASQQQMTK